MTNKVINDKYIIEEVIGKDGQHVVYRGTQRMAQGIERPIALKLLHGWNVEDEQEKQYLVREISTMVELGNSPYIVTVHDFGLDQEYGPWVVMEQARNDMHARIEDNPANPSLVRQVTSQMLQALMMMHERENPIVHRDVKPRNILQLAEDSWALSDFGLATSKDAEKTLSEVSVKYAAPELIDSERGKVSGACDLYSLGMSLYELALGNNLFREKFPSVYGTLGSKESDPLSSDERAKWLYWHTSPQLTLPPLEEVLPGFPEDLSGIIEKMLHKSLETRAESARGLFQELVTQDVARSITWEGPKKTKSGMTVTPMAKILLGIILFVLVGGAVAVGLMGHSQLSDIELDKSEYLIRSKFVRISGRIIDPPAGGELVLYVRKNLTSSRANATIDSKTGKFAAQLEVPNLGEYSGIAVVLSSEGKQLAQRLFTVVRMAPASVHVQFVLRPVVFGADLEIKAVRHVGGAAAEPQVIKAVSDAKGVAKAEIPYGTYELKITHPRYTTYDKRLNTELNERKKQDIRLVPLSEQVLNQKRATLREEYESLKARAEAGDREAIKRRTELQKELAQLADPEASDNEVQKKRQELLAKAESLRAAAERGDPAAIEELRKVNKQLSDLDKQSQEDELDKLAKKRAELKRRAESGDPVAKRQLEQLDRQLRARGLNPDKLDEQVNARRTKQRQKEYDRVRKQRQEAEKEADELEALAKKRADLVRRAAAGDPEAKRQLEELDKKLRARGIDPDKIEQAARKARKKATDLKRQEAIAHERLKEAQRAGGRSDSGKSGSKGSSKTTASERDTPMTLSQRREALKKKMRDLAARVAAGDPEAIKEYRKAQRKLALLDAAEKLQQSDSQKKILETVKALRDRVAAGDPEAMKELKELERKSSILKALSQGKITPEEAARLLAGASKLSQIDEITIMSMELEALKHYIQDNVPSRAIFVEEDSTLDKLRVRGSVIDKEELMRVLLRLSPAEKRVNFDIRVDPNRVVNDLIEALGEAGLEDALVHPFLIGPNHRLYLGLPEGASGDKIKAAKLLAEEFVVESSLVDVERTPKAPAKIKGGK